MHMAPLLAAWQRFESEQSKSQRAHRRWLHEQLAVTARRRRG